MAKLIPTAIADVSLHLYNMAKKMSIHNRKMITCGVVCSHAKQEDKCCKALGISNMGIIMDHPPFWLWSHGIWHCLRTMPFCCLQWRRMGVCYVWRPLSEASQVHMGTWGTSDEKPSFLGAGHEHPMISLYQPQSIATRLVSRPIWTYYGIWDRHGSPTKQLQHVFIGD